ncbi:hypothetical protein XENOCAPTIV_028564, partial [Xenoophorus captivus]
RILKQFPGDRVPAAAAAMADQLLETVERLQSRIQDNPEPRKLLKTLRRLGEVPMTVDILVVSSAQKLVHSAGTYPAVFSVHLQGFNRFCCIDLQILNMFLTPFTAHEVMASDVVFLKFPSSGSALPGRPRPPKDSLSKEEDDDFETPTMSFESFLTYDAPTPVKKKKKPLPSSAAEPKPEKRKRVVEALPTLPDIPLPAIQPNYRPLPSIDTPLSPQRRKEIWIQVPSVCCIQFIICRKAEGFTGKRFNSKMVVYSGSKTSYLPRMMTLYEQCIRVLQNNIDCEFSCGRCKADRLEAIAEVGGVPFEILEPVLERCTPEQLYRIEQSNQVCQNLKPEVICLLRSLVFPLSLRVQCFMEDSDDLWMRHCKRDFKRESPQEFESWREMYLRLHDEREERLRLLTQNISSAHANKPKGRQVKMAFVHSVAKPPRDVRRRQEKFGTSSGSSTASTASPTKSSFLNRIGYFYGLVVAQNQQARLKLLRVSRLKPCRSDVILLFLVMLQKHALLSYFYLSCGSRSCLPPAPESLLLSASL